MLAARILMGIGALSLALALWLTLGVTAHYLISGEKAVGVVVDMVGGGSSYEPVVDFTTASGETRRYTGLGSGEPAYRPGEGVAIRYFPDNPKKVIISSSFHEMWLGNIIAGGLGVIFGGIGLLIRRSEMPRPRPTIQAQRRPAKARPPQPRQQKRRKRNHA